MKTTCGDVCPKFIWYFCYNGNTIKGYDIYELKDNLQSNLIRTDYFSIDDTLLTNVDVSQLTVGACGTAVETSRFDVEIICVEENTEVHMAKYDTLLNTYRVYNLSWPVPVDVSGSVTPIQCPWQAEKYDIRSAGMYCDNGTSVERFDIVDISWGSPIIVSSVWQDMLGTIINAPDPSTLTVWACNSVIQTEIETSRIIDLVANPLPSNYTFTRPMNTITVFNGTQAVMYCTVLLTTPTSTSWLLMVNPNSSIDIAIKSSTIQWVDVDIPWYTPVSWDYRFVNALYD